MIIAYLRISTGKQFLSNQREEIRRYADGRNWVIDQWVTEVASGSRKGSNRKLGILLKQMKRGDTLIVTEVSRLSRTLTDIMSIMGLCLEKGINLYTTKEGVFVRQFHQQQGALLRFRTGGGDRTQPDFHAHP